MEINNQIAKIRTHLANERTLLAYIRTSIAFILAGTGYCKIISRQCQIDSGRNICWNWLHYLTVWYFSVLAGAAIDWQIQRTGNKNLIDCSIRLNWGEHTVEEMKN
ncbi:MAG: DUF202 domain-containing protein [Candidatus Marinimicrobia bacterium]|nr:DUF202 domain-containing protein [Candidatus Neomarinimicrobiota bacterium]